MAREAAFESMLDDPSFTTWSPEAIAAARAAIGRKHSWATKEPITATGRNWCCAECHAICTVPFVGHEGPTYGCGPRAAAPPPTPVGSAWVVVTAPPETSSPQASTGPADDDDQSMTDLFEAAIKAVGGGQPSSTATTPTARSPQWPSPTRRAPPPPSRPSSPPSSSCPLRTALPLWPRPAAWGESGVSSCPKVARGGPVYGGPLRHLWPSPTLGGWPCIQLFQFSFFLWLSSRGIWPEREDRSGPPRTPCSARPATNLVGRRGRCSPTPRRTAWPPAA